MIPLIIDLTYNDNASDIYSHAESTLVISVHTMVTRYSTITRITIHLINTKFKDKLKAYFMQQFHIFMEIDEGTCEYICLEDLLNSAYQESFPMGENIVHMTLGETYQKYMDRFMDSESIDGD